MRLVTLTDGRTWVLPIQDSALRIAVGSLLWMENLKDGETRALGVDTGFAPQAANGNG